MTTGSVLSHRVLPGRGSELASGPIAAQGWPAVAIARAQGTVVLTLVGTVDASGAEWLEHLLVDLVDGQGNRSIALDLRQVGAVDPAVLALLVSVSGRVLRSGGRLVLRDPSVAFSSGSTERAWVVPSRSARAVVPRMISRPVPFGNGRHPNRRP